MTDRLRTLHQDLLSGSYDCVDRIVLNAYPDGTDAHYYAFQLAMHGVFRELGIAA